MAASRPGRGQGLRVREVTRTRLLETAEAMFLARGYAETSVDAIAHAAGYTTGAVYSNFGGKADLFLAVLESRTDAELAAVRSALAAATTDEQRLRVFTTAVAADPDGLRRRVSASIEFMSEVRRHPELKARVRAAQELADRTTREILAALCTALGIAPAADLEAVTRDVTALLTGYGVRSLYDDRLDLPAAVAGAVNSILSGRRDELVGVTAAAGAQATR